MPSSPNRYRKVCVKQWEKNSNGRYEIELYWDFAPYSFGFAERTPDGQSGIVGGLL